MTIASGRSVFSRCKISFLIPNQISLCTILAVDVGA